MSSKKLAQSKNGTLSTKNGSAASLGQAKRPATTASTRRNEGSKLEQLMKATACTGSDVLLPRQTHASTESLMVVRTSSRDIFDSQLSPTLDSPGSQRSILNTGRSTLTYSNSQGSMPSLGDKSPSHNTMKGPTESSKRRGAVVSVKDKHIQREEEKRDLRKHVLAGDFMNGKVTFEDMFETTASLWMLKQWQLLVFVSSTFTGKIFDKLPETCLSYHSHVSISLFFALISIIDTRCERNILLDHILPKLRQQGFPYDIEVTFVDMRWGISDDHTVDHKTWDECRREIGRCRDNSSGLFFISLQSDKYGYRPLPRKVDRKNFETCLSKCEDEAVKNLANLWYTVDTNNTPEMFILKKLESVKDQEYYDKVLPALRSLLYGVRFDTSACRGVMCGRSVSEWEFKFALKNPADADRCLWFRRDFEHCNFDDSSYCDTKNDDQVTLMLSDLKDFMTKKIGTDSSRIKKCRIAYDDLTGHGEETVQYYKAWEGRALLALQEELQAIIRLRVQWETDACGMGLSGHVAAEFLHHAKWAHDCCIQFCCREMLLAEAMRLWDSPSRMEDPRTLNFKTVIRQRQQSSSSGRFDCISFAAIGAPGSGKSSLMAKLADTIYKHEIERWNRESSTSKKKKTVMAARPVIIRFCGTSDNSMDSEALMKSLRVQVEYLLGPVKKKSAMPLSNWEHLNEALKQHAVVILIDGIDALTGGFDFFKDMVPHEHTRIIISASKQAEPSSVFDKIMREAIPVLEVMQLSANAVPISASPLSARSTPRESVAERKGVSRRRSKDMAPQSSEIQMIVEQTLAKKARRLTPRQMSLVVERIVEEPSILYLNLVCSVAEHWNSSLVDPELGSSLGGIFSQIMTYIEQECGETASRHALSIITFSFRGANDNEIEDLLSMNLEVLYSIFQYDYPNTFRVPSHVWMKLRISLSGLLVERLHGCLTWRHQELQALAEERYTPADPQIKMDIYREIATYFGNRVDDDVITRKRIARFPLLLVGSNVWLESSKPNQRRFEEAAYGFIMAKMYTEAAEELCDFEIICATAKCGHGVQYVSTLKLLSTELMGEDDSNMGNLRTRVGDYLSWAEKNMLRIMEAPAIMIPVTVTAEPETSLARQEFMAYMQSVKPEYEFTPTDWIRGMCLSQPPPSVNGPVGINCVRWSPDDSKIVGGSDDSFARVWDSTTGSIVLTLTGHRSSVTCADWSSDGFRIVTGSCDGTAIIWNSESGEMLRMLSNKHTMDINCVSYSPNGQHIATGSKDTNVILWPADDNSTKDCQKFSMVKDFSVTCVQWSPNSKFFAASLVTSPVRVWDIETRKVKTFQQGVTQRVSSLCWDTGGERIASACADGCVYIWSPQNPSKVLRIFREHGQAVESVSWNPSLDSIVSGDSNGCIMVWEADSGVVLVSLQGHSDCVNDVQWNRMGNKIASASKDGKLIIWDSAC